MTAAAPADALTPQFAETALAAASGLSRGELGGLALTLSLTLLATAASVLLIRSRAHAGRVEAAAQEENAALRAEADRLRTMLTSEPQVLISWQASAGAPQIVGNAAFAATQAQNVLAFETWLNPAAAAQLDDALGLLKTQGRSFTMNLMSIADEAIEAEGRAVGGSAVLRLRHVGGVRRELTELSARHEMVLGTAQTLRNLIDVLPAPIWAHDETGVLTFVNAAYVRAVEANDASDAVENSIELFDRAERKDIAAARNAGLRFSARMPAVVAGARRAFDVVDQPSGHAGGRHGSAGIAIDATEVEAARAELARMAEANRRILDELPIGVAVFSAEQKLVFYNAAYRALWDLDAAMLDQGPSDSGILDQLRAARKLPEEQDFRQWKTRLHEAYRAVETREHMWHFADGRALRVVTMPNAEGGVIYLFHDVSARLNLERKYDSLIKVQSETLDHLTDAVAVFGSDGRVRLHNPAFARMWKFTPEVLDEHPHVAAVTAWCQAQHDDSAVWGSLKNAVTAIDQRRPAGARIERRDGAVIDCATMPLPDGATMMMFHDVTDSVGIERALRERNEALVAADQIKIDFVKHVSYTLRSPLTNIIGFAEFLGEPALGALTPRQREYLGYITGSTDALLAIINNILDLATIDAGAMTLKLGPVDVRETLKRAAEGVKDRLIKNDIALNIDVAPGVTTFTADGGRVRQVLFNLVSNAVSFSPASAAVTVTVRREDDSLVFAVTDNGPGIPPESLNRVFDWFESDSFGSQHRGAGLGLSLVRSFVELHRGTVTIDSEVGRGTTVVCVFPLDQAARQDAA